MTDVQFNSVPMQIGAYSLKIMVRVSAKPVSLPSFQQYSCQVHILFYTHFAIMFPPRTCEQMIPADLERYSEIQCIFTAHCLSHCYCDIVENRLQDFTESLYYSGKCSTLKNKDCFNKDWLGYMKIPNLKLYI